MYFKSHFYLYPGGMTALDCPLDNKSEKAEKHSIFWIKMGNQYLQVNLSTCVLISNKILFKKIFTKINLSGMDIN